MYGLSSHRHKSVAWNKFDIVWLYRSPISEGRKGVIISFKGFLSAFAAFGGRGSAPCVANTQLCSLPLRTYFSRRTHWQNTIPDEKLCDTLPLHGYYLECGTLVSSAWLTGSWSILLRLVSRLADNPVTCQANTIQFDLKVAWECDIVSPDMLLTDM
jgi:hypothetical protein